MKILIFTSVFYPSVGGLENLTLNLVNEFIKDGHEVKVITEQRQTAKLDQVEVFHSSNIFKSIQLFIWCDVFYMPNISLKGIWLLGLNPFKKWIISHNDFSLYNKTTVVSKIKLFLIKFATHNISVSKSVANCINTQSQIVYNCYDESIFHLDKEADRVYDFVFVGRLVSQKGCNTLIKACSKLDKPFVLNIIGEGPEFKRLQKVANDYGMIGKVNFLGLLQNHELAKALNQHRTLIVPSINEEGFGIVALEGMACGCKIIASNAGGLAEAVDEFGEIYPMGAIDELSILLSQDLEATNTYSITDNPDLVKYLHDHSKNVVAKQYFNIFNQ